MLDTLPPVSRTYASRFAFEGELRELVFELAPLAAPGPGAGPEH